MTVLLFCICVLVTAPVAYGAACELWNPIKDVDDTNTVE